MTLHDLIDYLCDKHARQTLTEEAVIRCIFLAFELGMQAMRDELRGAAVTLDLDPDVLAQEDT